MLLDRHARLWLHPGQVTTREEHQHEHERNDVVSPAQSQLLKCIFTSKCNVASEFICALLLKVMPVVVKVAH